MDNATVIDALKAKFGDAIQHSLEYRGAPIAWVAPERLVEDPRHGPAEPPATLA